MIHEIYGMEELGELRRFLEGIPGREAAREELREKAQQELREELYGEFLRYCRYRNVEEWNRAVRVCECLAIVGWGEHEPVEAVRGSYFNGNPNTYFINRDKRPRYFDAVWSKRGEVLAIDFSRSSFHASPDSPDTKGIVADGAIGEIKSARLASQRNWIPKNPICITRGIANCYENSKGVIDSIEADLKPVLNRGMRPELYGWAIDQIVLNLAFSFYDNYHCKTNYIIADESLKLKERELYPALLNMFSEKEIEDNGYYLRNRFSYGPFRAATGTANIFIVFEKEFSEQSPRRQKQLLSEYLRHAVGEFAKRQRKKITYDFELMIADFSAILSEWVQI